jgi:predicted Fe-S protein YdhL (DUF1289 family)
MTPCISQCRLVADKCSGCGRTKEQITKWTKYTDAERLTIINQLKQKDTL